MRAARAGRHEARDGVSPRSGGAGKSLRGAGLRISARRRSRRRLCRQAGQCRRGRAHPGGDRDPGAARRRHPRHRHRRGLAGQGRHPRHHRHRGGARSRLRQGSRARFIPPGSSVALDARDGKVAVEGWARDLRAHRPRRRQAVRGRGRRGLDLHRHFARRPAHRPQPRRHHRARRGGRHPGHRFRRARLDRRTSRRCSIRARSKLAGAIAGRALYDGRLDAAAALALIRAARGSDR